MIHFVSLLGLVQGIRFYLLPGYKFLSFKAADTFLRSAGQWQPSHSLHPISWELVAFHSFFFVCLVLYVWWNSVRVWVCVCLTKSNNLISLYTLSDRVKPVLRDYCHEQLSPVSLERPHIPHRKSSSLVQSNLSTKVTCQERSHFHGSLSRQHLL